MPFTPATIRLACFAGVFVAMALLEAWLPRRPRAFSRRLRWTNNLALTALGTILVRIALPGSALAVALIGEERAWGLLNHFAIPRWVALALAVVLLDLVIYLQHVLLHAVPIFWRLHRVHHADLDFDVTTGSRFHPIESVLSMGIKMAAVAALGAPVFSVLVFEILLNATSLFNHANLRLPHGLDRALRCIVVTPDMHRVHHSSSPRETNSNFGFNLPWWDRLFGTYRAEPEAGHEGMTLGIQQFRSHHDLRVDRMLIQPFVRRIDNYPIASPTETWIESDQLAQLENVLVVDVRGPEEFNGPLGHIPGAENIPVDEIETRLDELKSDPSRPIVLVCKTDRRSAAAAKFLRARGFRETLVLRGGMEKWNREERETIGLPPD